ncbi:hypothetical protein SAMN04488502_11443 [Dendrosporobacter quercicolus]|uniref:Uncharacterized protein n=1 Tax=Dendrosporobacter quercicolus TaxID=146817 RepID=A0A1G9ZHE7_9FIRM|nr:hypothetical protein SAMN04488502_11443 [Dendrosporobacter quercicolus]
MQMGTGGPCFLTCSLIAIFYKRSSFYCLGPSATTFVNILTNVV